MFSDLSMFITKVPEPLALLIFGACLTGGTIALRWLLKRHDRNADGER